MNQKKDGSTPNLLNKQIEINNSISLNSQEYDEIISRRTKTFHKDMTMHWSCQKGDYLLWIRCKSLMSLANNFTIADLWEMKDGDFITITNRQADFPSWFTLYPDEVSGLAC